MVKQIALNWEITLLVPFYTLKGASNHLHIHTLLYIGKKQEAAMANNTTVATFFLALLLLLCSTACSAFRPKFIPPKLPPPNPFCPRDTLKFGACADLIGGVANLVAGEALGSKCCALLQGLANGEAAACLCTAVKESVLGVLTTEWSVAVSLLVSSCKKKIPDGFKCV